MCFMEDRISKVREVSAMDEDQDRFQIDRQKLCEESGKKKMNCVSSYLNYRMFNYYCYY